MATKTKNQLSDSIPKRKKSALRDKPVEISPNQLAFEFYDAPFNMVGQQLSIWKYKIENRLIICDSIVTTENHLEESFK